jgi:hypothetical protein
LKPSLRKWGLYRAHAVEDHLPPQIHQGKFHRFGIGGADVPLEQHHHAQQSRRPWRIASPRRPIHAFQLLLKRVVEELVPMQSEKSEQRTDANQTLHEQLLLP